MSIQRNIDWEAVLAEAVALGLPNCDVARAQRVSAVSVWKAAKKHGVTLPSVKARNAVRWARILENAQAAGLSQADVARAEGVTPQRVCDVCREFGVQLADGNKKRCAA